MMQIVTDNIDTIKGAATSMLTPLDDMFECQSKDVYATKALARVKPIRQDSKDHQGEVNPSYPYFYKKMNKQQ